MEELIHETAMDLKTFVEDHDHLIITDEIIKSYLLDAMVELVKEEMEKL